MVEIVTKYSTIYFGENSIHVKLKIVVQLSCCRSRKRTHFFAGVCPGGSCLALEMHDHLLYIHIHSLSLP